MPPLPQRVKNKQQRYAAYAGRGADALRAYKNALAQTGLLGGELV